MATPQTLAWACDHADAALMEKLLVYDEDVREKTLQHIAAQSIEDEMHHPYPGAKMLEPARFEQPRPGRVLLHLPGANGDGYEFQQTPEGWKPAVTMVVVDDYIRQSAKRASKP